MKLHARTLIPFMAAALTASLLTACTSASPTGTAPAAEFEHTHGLGHDSATGIVFAATHNGVWELPTDQLPSSFGTGSLKSTPGDIPVLIADRRQDTMGFLVTDSGMLLGSGHPDPADASAPANLGLIASNNAAQDWTPVSLSGETDFHDLAAATTANGAIRIYGYDATQGTILISDDSGATWAGGAALDLRDLAADASNPDRVYATTASGLQVSDDAARTFTPVADAPALYLIDAADNGYVGIDTKGSIWHTGQDGGWVQGAVISGESQALSFVGGTEPWLLVADGRGIRATPDYGASWVPLIQQEGQQ
ncbi:WD40/YVTN/BNR-like repeat-containing protein [Herbiconiux sp. YIM B11900]|uniref:WD40/YVTN/BNR-like repeat-containing protein n=1 Tax=Herbiconiux sp. YIM B11900 TaxID=3404131 RepID=UPI003F878CF0